MVWDKKMTSTKAETIFFGMALIKAVKDQSLLCIWLQLKVWIVGKKKSTTFQHLRVFELQHRQVQSKLPNSTQKSALQLGVFSEALGACGLPDYVPLSMQLSLIPHWTEQLLLSQDALLPWQGTLSSHTHS